LLRDLPRRDLLLEDLVRDDGLEQGLPGDAVRAALLAVAAHLVRGDRIAVDGGDDLVHDFRRDRTRRECDERGKPQAGRDAAERHGAGGYHALASFCNTDASSAITPS
jgi:hypothetical protein